MNKEISLTPEGQADLENELTHLQTVRRREVGERIKEAKEFGDISENSEYDDAKNEQAWVESRILEIEEILAHATIVDAPKRADRVALGCKVTLKDLDKKEEQVYTVVGSAEADPTNRKISNESPVGEAIMGLKKGDKAEVTTPSGRVLKYEIVKVSR